MFDEQNKISINNEKNRPPSRNLETLLFLVVFSFLYLLLFSTVAKGGFATFFALIIWGGTSTVGLLLLFWPTRKLIRLCLDGQNKFYPRLAILVLFLAFLVFIAFHSTPEYVKTMQREAKNYYQEHPEQFDNPVEGQTISIQIFNGPYVTYFIYTEEGFPKNRGDTVVDFSNGWYFIGFFGPA